MRDRIKGLMRNYRRDGSMYPAGADGLMEWARDHELAGNRVIDTTYTPYGEMVSTVWLGINLNFFGSRPLIFETMIFGKGPKYQTRYSTETEALDGHLVLYWQCLIPPPLRRFLFKNWSA